MNCIKKFLDGLVSHEEDPADSIASLVLAAKDNAALRSQILYVLDFPTDKRRILVDSAIEKMTLNGESESIKSAFAILATDIGARAVSRILEEGIR
jgi:hypothetical protein